MNAAAVLYRSSRQWRLAGAGLVAMGALFVGLGGLIAASQHDPSALAVIAFAVPWLLGGAWVWRWDLRHAIEVGPDGLVWHGATRREVRWEDIVAYRFGATHLQARGLAEAGAAAVEASGVLRGSGPIGRKLALTLRCRDGGTARIDQRTERVQTLIDRVLGHVHGRLLAEARHALDQVGAVTFATLRDGPITLTRDTLAWGRSGPVPLARISSVRLRQGQLLVEGAFTLRFREIENLFVLLALLNERRGAA
jgi:hypothetical protein